MSRVTPRVIRYPPTDMPSDEKHEPLINGDYRSNNNTPRSNGHSHKHPINESKSGLTGSRSFETTSYVDHPDEDDFPMSASTMNNQTISQSNTQTSNPLEDGKLTFNTANKVLGGIIIILIAAIITLLYQKLESPTVKPLFPPTEPGIPTGPEAGYEATYQSLFADPSYRTRMGTHLEYLSNNTHLAGSSYDYMTALYVQQVMRTAGIPIVEIDQHSVLLSTPIHRSLRMNKPTTFVANLTEAVYDVDPTSSRVDVPTFHAYAANATLLASDVVFVHYCARSHFDRVHAMDVNVKGKICMCKYGSGWRGDKVSQATDAGCSGVLMYSDPQDDGYVQGPTYPEGPWKPATGVQRGSIMNGNGDPLSPDWPSAADSSDGYRLNVSVARGPAGRLNNDTPLPTIPSLPISWFDALPLLAAMKGPVADSDWQGGLNITYHIGGDGTLQVDFIIALSEVTIPIWSVIGTIPGQIYPEQEILMGAHRDAWTFGATDPLSGTIALLGTAEALGAMITTQDWTPSRTIKICSWDGEEAGLIGSVEYVDEHETSLLMNAVAYINMDEAVTGFDYLEIDGHPLLSRMVADISKQIPAPDANASQTLYDCFLASQPTTLAPFPYPVLSGIGGTGSDFGSFVQRVGVLSLDLGFNSNDGHYSGVYHTAYDSFTWMNRFSDGRNHYAYHSAMSQLVGSLAMRLADSQVSPITVSPYAALFQSMLSPLMQDGVKAFPSLAKAFSQLQSALTSFGQAAVALDAAVAQLSLQLTTDTPPSAWKLQSVNQLLSSLDRYFLYLPGIPGRSWYRHLVFATSLSDGYSGAGLAIISDAIDANDQDACARSLWFLQHSLTSLTRQMTLMS